MCPDPSFEDVCRVAPSRIRDRFCTVAGPQVDPSAAVDEDRVLLGDDATGDAAVLEEPPPCDVGVAGRGDTITVEITVPEEPASCVFEGAAIGDTVAVIVTPSSAGALDG